MPYCPGCGLSIDEWVKLCPFCGRPVALEERARSEVARETGAALAKRRLMWGIAAAAAGAGAAAMWRSGGAVLLVVALLCLFQIALVSRRMRRLLKPPASDGGIGSADANLR